MKQKILVVEDNELNLKLFCDLLRAHDYEAEPVRDGREALERARGFAPDLIVMDIQMPHISGLELIERLKDDAALKATPIMAVTAYAAKGDEERIRDAGAEGYVSKPISVPRFVEAVRSLLAVPVTSPVRVERRFEAACERVFDAWLDADTAGEWLFATPEGEMVRVEIDARTGGRYEIVERRAGEDVVHTGIYEVLERARQLVFTLQVPKYSHEESRVAIHLSPEREGCALDLDAGEAPAADAAKYRQGWTMILDGLARHLGEGKDELE